MDEGLERRLVARRRMVLGEIVDCELVEYPLEQLGPIIFERYGCSRFTIKTYRLVLEVEDELKEFNITTNRIYSVGDKYSILKHRWDSN